MKTGGQGSGAGAAATTVLLVALLVLAAASMRADAAAAARCRGDPKPNPCTHDQNNPGHKCHVPPPPGKQAAAAHTEAQSRRLISVSNSKAPLGHSDCTNGPSAPPGPKCPTPPSKAP
ncbi:hypothetical protein BAE44_0023206 [Dichanthelium oligosanthes]|uniref:Uncharacterized protein n=1 Tax=Dichanthelium oligosanthes TaxID=888268 RepID=A0A1E5USK0_9POAL|nr:hypothetical protein BAE44_0023206 [Dichanthelium oligosanthes]